ncbi:WAS/WASL-interacting protein family member 1-like [Salvia splendens]|uniref:WAS/WASL-interacting protein family member 1-like n=1 Tax=Salvia splendens TaxID=180675 RepID=UPI001C2800AE|nr:WAS/WASL-interacting protein family member 1-like [Salvia splendens]
MDALNQPRPETHFQSNQSLFTDADRFALEQMMGCLSPGLPDTPPARVDTPVLTRVGGFGGAGGSSGGGSGSGGGEGSEATGAGGKRSTHYTKAESIDVARDADTSDPIVGIPNRAFGSASCWHTTSSSQEAPNRVTRNRDGRSEADVKTLSMSQFNTEGWPKFNSWEEYLVLENCPKFKAICVEERGTGPGAKRTRHNIVGDYSSGSGSQSIDLNDAQTEEPSAIHSRSPRPPVQHASIRATRVAASSSRISQPTPIPHSMGIGPHEVLQRNLDVQLMKQL